MVPRKKISKRSGAQKVTGPVGATVPSGATLRSLLEMGDAPERLVVAPLLEPDEQLRDDQASVDIRLGCQFVLTQASAYGDIDEFPESEESTGLPNLLRLYHKLYVPVGDNLVIHPHEFVLATSLEYVRLPRNLMAFVVGRSTWGRLGLVVATAIGVHPLFAGTITLELRNLGETPLRLYPGERIAQLFFERVDEPEQETAAPGRYVASVDPLPRLKTWGPTHERLRKLVDTYRASVKSTK